MNSLFLPQKHKGQQTCIVELSTESSKVNYLFLPVEQT